MVAARMHCINHIRTSPPRQPPLTAVLTPTASLLGFGQVSILAWGSLSQPGGNSDRERVTGRRVTGRSHSVEATHS